MATLLSLELRNCHHRPLFALRPLGTPIDVSSSMCGVQSGYVKHDGTITMNTTLSVAGQEHCRRAITGDAMPYILQLTDITLRFSALLVAMRDVPSTPDTFALTFSVTGLIAVSNATEERVS